MMPRALVLVTVTLFGCGDGGGFPADAGVDAPPPPGTFSLAWTVSGAGSTAITCEQIGAQAVTALLRNRAVQGGSTEVFTCSTLAGMSQALSPGIYDIGFDLNGVGGDPVTGVIATAPMQMGIEIKSNENTVLMPLAFVVNATGGMRLTLMSSATAGNCVPVAQQGAGIATNTITLTRASDGMCAPLTFSVSAGTMGGTAGTYVVDCATPAITPCIERDQELTVTGVASGTYAINVSATRAGMECFTTVDQLPVPPLGRELVRTLNLASVSPACP
ncbi:MAG: hypothetical protein H0T42_10410 [Deltaproteobacteria bacterium]|nr:hypothetical protein [Deltaproteobacteria bacterium]